MSNSTDPKYTAARRQYKKAHAALAGAHDFLARTAGDDDYDTFDADLLLDKASRLVNADFAAVTKACHVGVYQPYGGRGGRRW